MIKNKLNNRHTVFTTKFADWDLHLHVIEAKTHTYIIDTGLGSENVLEVLTYLKDKENNNPLYIINTHSHWDHVWGNHLVEDFPILSSRMCYEVLERSWDEVYDKYKEYAQGDVKKCLPNTLMDHDLYFKEDGIHVFSSVGHTKDGISVYDEIDQILNVGDNIGDSMEELIPDLEVDLEVYYESVKKYLSYDFKLCVCGHNQVLQRETVEQLRAQIEEEL